jgi:GrpB-like predicted nucleotidyltransferase (UPF0157 family)
MNDAPASRIAIVGYDPTWPDGFEREAERLQRALGPICTRIDHVGSTSVPQLAAKPVIDIQISVAQLHPLDPYRDRLSEVGYFHYAHSDDRNYPFFHKPADWPHSHHVHVCSRGSQEERQHLAFCAYLRDHREVANAYEQLKRRLAEIHSAETMSSRNAYSDAKSAFIGDIIERALAAGYPR